MQALAKSRMHFRKARKCGMQSVQHSKLSVNITLASADAKKHSRHSQRWEHFTHAENPQRDGEQPRGQRGHFVADYAEASRSNEARAGNVKLKTSGVKIMPGLTSPIQERGRRDHQTHGAEQGLGSADSTGGASRTKREAITGKRVVHPIGKRIPRVDSNDEEWVRMNKGGVLPQIRGA